MDLLWRIMFHLFDILLLSYNREWICEYEWWIFVNIVQNIASKLLVHTWFCVHVYLYCLCRMWCWCYRLGINTKNRTACAFLSLYIFSSYHSIFQCLFVIALYYVCFFIILFFGRFLTAHKQNEPKKQKSAKRLQQKDKNKFKILSRSYNTVHYRTRKKWTVVQR
jgi:hypothetical protein